MRELQLRKALRWWDNACHRLTYLTGLSHGIVNSVVILPIMCTVCMSALSFLIFLHLYRLALGQRPSLMYYSSYRCLVSMVAALKEPWSLRLPLCLLIAYCL